jgi:hypothetical protein
MNRVLDIITFMFAFGKSPVTGAFFNNEKALYSLSEIELYAEGMILQPIYEKLLVNIE